MTACVALLDALEPNRPESERRSLLRTAVESALDALGTPSDSRPDISDLLARFELRPAATV